MQTIKHIQTSETCCSQFSTKLYHTCYILLSIEGDNNSGNTLTPRCSCWRRPDEARDMSVVFLEGQKGISPPRGWHQHDWVIQSTRMDLKLKNHRDSGFHQTWNECEDFETEKWLFFFEFAVDFEFGPGLCEDVGLIHGLERWKLLFSPSAHGSRYFWMSIAPFRYGIKVN